VDHVQRVELEQHRLVLGQVQHRGDDRLAVRPGIGELERELARGDVDRLLVGLGVLVGAQHRVGVGAQTDDQDRRDRRPDDLEPGVAVDRRAVLVVPLPVPPHDEGVAGVDEHAGHDRGGHHGHHPDVELLAGRRRGQVARRQVRSPDEPEEQVRHQGDRQPDQEDPQPVVRFRPLGPGDGIGGDHYDTTCMLPIM
jgi:hypothetical protein